MGEGAALFVLKRLSDAERDGDRIYAVLLGLAGSSDGRGKGITAPNPVGQRLAVERAWHVSGVDPALATCIEAHGTSTRVGDATELASLTDVFRKAGAANGSIALGSVKSNIGHLKGAAGAAGLFKTVLGLHEKVLTPSLHFDQPNENVDWDDIPFRVNTELREWPAPASGVRCAGVSAFGFGGTNFHAVLEEYVPGRHRAQDASRSFPGATVTAQPTAATGGRKAPLRGAAVVGGADEAEVAAQLEQLAAEASGGRAPAPGSAGPRAGRCGRSGRHRLRRCGRPGDQGGEGGAGTAGRRQPGHVEDTARPGRLRRSRRTGQGRVPLHRPGLAVREHAG